MARLRGSLDIVIVKDPTHIHIKIFVGRKTTARAASTKVLRSVIDSIFDVSCVLGIAHCHGHLLRAMTVNAVSRQLEKVRVEQNQCHGLRTVMIN